MRKISLAVSVVALIALVVPTRSNAQVYFGEDMNSSGYVPLSSTPNSDAAADEFLDRLVGTGTETFESFSAGEDPPLNLTFPGAGTATLTGSGEIESVAPGTANGAGRYATSGSKFFEISTGSLFEIVFSEPVAAFGFFGVDISDFGEELYLTFVRDAGSNTELTVPNTLGAGSSTDGSVLFYGFIDDVNPFDAVQFRSSTGEVFAFDDMTIGSVDQVIPPNSTVPEPISMALLGTGLAGVAAARRRKRAEQDND
ncbi:MAG TPA: PEP-CTERM sorting domain-containing protein [Longimicrobiaceae bacterium]|nr:PEP-CTERM sorting domain-containing protein [Longimicrobiaceae bacterium]